jgi:predicted negative regulator of RcsB-dependent stress response
VVIAQDSGNRDNESHLALNLAWLEAEHGDTASAFDHLTLSIRNYHDSRDTALIRAPLAILAALFDRLGHHEAAVTTAEFAANPFTTATNPEITTAIAHLRDVLGDQTYESLARKGETMTTTAMATYAYDQIDQARAELKAVSQDEFRES